MKIPCALILVSVLAAAAHAAAMDPATTVLPCHELPAVAAADGDLSEWAGVPPSATPEKFKLLAEDKNLEPCDEFAPTLYAGRKPGSSDLFFLLVMKDRHIHADESAGWPYGDCLELFLDFGRASRDVASPEWRKDPNIGRVPEMSQFGFTPHTPWRKEKFFRIGWGRNWKLDFASAPTEGGTAYEIRVDGQSVLEDLKLKEMPEVVGLDLGLMGIDYPVILESGGWNNHRGCFRLFGDWTAIAHPCRYGGLSTKPSPRGAGDEPPARTLRSLYGRFPAVEDLEKEEIKKLSPEQVADLLYWKVCEGQTLSPALARQVMASPSARLRETGLLLLAAAGQDPAARRESLKAVYEHPDQNTPQALALANLANEELGAGYGAQLLPLLKHPDLTVAITAAGALSKVGEKEQRVPFEQAVRELAESFDRDTAGKPKAAAVRAFMQPALDLATFRLEAPPLPKEAPTRVPDAKNTDLPRLMPADNNNVYDGAGLLRKWPEGGPRELWRQEIGDGYPAVIEAGGKAFAVGVFERKPHAYAFEAETGKPLWKKPLLGRKPGYLGASPVADDDRVYFSLDGAVVCLNASDGSEKWREEKAFGGATFATPLVVGDAIYVPGKSLAAADKLTGKLLWKTDGPAASPASPCYQMLDGVPQIVQAVGGGSEAALWGVSAKSGEVFWKTPIKIGYGLCSSPVAQGSRVLISSGVPGSEFFTALQMFVADGRIKALPAFTSREAQANYANTMAVWQGVVFGFGSGGLECAEAATGKRLWRQKDPGWTQEHQLIVADGLIFALSSESLVLLEASREGCRELARVKAPVKLAAQLQQPTLANGRLYLRGEKWIVCYAVK